MAKIVTITNPLTGQPAQVDQLDHTAQQIDDGLNIARGVSNPNLLDNWYFGNPVNQRGQTSYSGAGYTIDRWMNENDKVVSTLENGLLKLTFSGVSTYMQKLQVPAGIQVTCSVLVENIDGDLRLLWQDIESYTDTHEMKLSKGMNTLTVTTTKQNYRFSIYSNNADTKTISLVGVKLELGTQQTLAHQDENGVWQLNALPNYGEQLARCQRYQFGINPTRYGRPAIGVSTSQSSGAFVLSLPVTMREIPTVTFRDLQVFYLGNNYNVTSINVSGLTDNAVLMDITFDAAIPNGVALILVANEGSELLLNANL